MLKHKTIVITGLPGQVGKPVAEALARDNDVIGLARFLILPCESSLRQAESTV